MSKETTSPPSNGSAPPSPPVTLEAVDELVADSCVDHDPTPGQGHGPQGLGRDDQVRGMQIGRFEAGRLVERWGSTDQLTMISQLRIVDL